MIGYLSRRIGQAMLVLLLTCGITFLIFALLPSGDPAVARAGRHASPEVIAHVRSVLGLNHSLPDQFWIFLRNLVLHFNFGYSYVSGVSVRSLLASHLPATMSVALGAAVLWIAVSLPAGVLAALHPEGRWDRFLSFVGLVTSSVPGYALAVGSLYLCADDVGAIRLLPGAGTYVPLSQNAGQWASSLILPWIALAIPFVGYYARLMRQSLYETLPEDFVRTARAKGVSERQVLLRHALRVAITPVLTSFGLDLGLLLGGAVLVELVFGIPGIGALSLQAVEASDLPTIQGTVLAGALFVVLANLIVDLIQAVLDPRVRQTG